ncbi:MAG: hypothetical protein AAF628_29345 [Planctomycetota bacterium]
MHRPRLLIPLTLSVLCIALSAQQPDAAPKPADPAAPALEIGQPAPAVRLNDQNGNAVEVGGERETWTVLAFYPKASTPG